ncbi:MAG: DUF1887 family protein [Prevotellaceae bacterium]|jgi:hypothetical protein|nr:DUF1887 family protein [Prevotellaceae bacterium]
MKTLLVTLIGDQTIPNVQFIKDKQDDKTLFLFVSTKKMEEKGVKDWIINVCKIEEDRAFTIIVDQFSLNDIEEKLNELNYDEYDKLIVNVTGGTKIMSHAVTEFFKEFASEIFYLTGIGNTILQVHPKTKQSVKSLINRINLDEYLLSHGFEMKGGKLSGIPFVYTQKFISLFLSNENSYSSVFRTLRDLRSDGKKKYDVNTVDGLSGFLEEIEFPLSVAKRQIITRPEIKYLTGEWFEEYIYYRFKQELNISDENIKTGIILSKNNTQNEFDVVFLFNGNLYTIECKTSIINEEFNLMLDTIYKATALQKNLGLYSKSNIFTLSSKENKEVQEAHFERGRLFNIDVFCREDIINCTSIAQLLKIQPC